MACALFFALLCVATVAQDHTVLLKDGAFNFPVVVDEDIQQKDGLSTLYITASARCVQSFVITTDLEAPSKITIAKINGVKDEEYTWTVVGEALASEGVSETIVVAEQTPTCGSTWRFVVKSSKSAPWKDVALNGEVVQTRAKRAEIVCSDPMTYPSECSAASDGAYCLPTLICGCTQDRDCFGNTDFPSCTAAGFCERCTVLETNPTSPTGNTDHLFCRTRYPGFATQPTTGDPLGNERVAPLNYWREVCIRDPPSSSGSCQRCNQAPIQPFNLGSAALNQGASGTFHCHKVGADRPICMDQAYMNFVGGTYDVNLRGSCVPCNVNAECSTAIPTKPVCFKATPAEGICQACAQNSDCSAANGGSNCQADGSCRSCTSNADCGALDGGEAPNQPSCNAGSGLCEALFQCSTNADCVGRGGANCQADRSCVDCTGNSLCGALDGGEVPGQAVCNVATRICGPCTTNAACVGAGGSNCQSDGSCRTCTSNADCGAGRDGGETPNQPICNTATGICEAACTTNQFCETRPGKNCQKDGTCLSCLSDTTCGALDGGETPDQSLCNTALGICTTPFQCTDNASCQGMGANCQKDGSCISCTPATCGALDGGEVPDQPNCNEATRVCIPACTRNSDCVNTLGSNCNKNGLCITCVTNADCGTTDGGEVQNEAACNPATGICEAPCTTNNDCAAKPGKNCQKDGTCKSCTGTPDCGLLDGGEIPDQPACNLGTGICTPCTANSDCPTDTPNCGSNGGCYNCNAPTASCGLADGPPGGPNNNQPHCDTFAGICVDYCTDDSHCPDECAPRCHLNRGCCVQCLEDGDCPGMNWRLDQADYTTCSSNSYTCVKGCSVDDDCPDDDTPACSPTTGECVECMFDTHCDDFTPVCSSDQTCVECVSNSHCAEGEVCVELQCTARGEAGFGSVLVISGFVSLMSLFVHLF